MSTEQRPIYGGQAVIEGVMIRGQRNIAVAVRRPDGTVATMRHALTSIYTGRLRRIPLVRGVIAMAETLTLGMRALSYSANVAAEAEGEEISKGSMAGMMLVSLSLAIGIFFLIPVFASDWLEELIGSALLANIAEGIIRLLLFLGYILLISRMEDIRRVFMYHGAEHMTVHAQEHGDPLEVEHIRKYPTAHPRCGTAFLLVVMVVAILAFIFVGREPFWWLITSRIVLVPAIAAVSYEVIRFSGRHAGESAGEPDYGAEPGAAVADDSAAGGRPDRDCDTGDGGGAGGGWGSGVSGQRSAVRERGLAHCVRIQGAG